MEGQDRLTCFVIMPFRVRKQDVEKYYNDLGHWTEVYNGLIVPSVKEAGLNVLRDDDDYSSRLVGIGVWSKIEKADIVLVDISAHNPNVHLELGWALRADKKIVFIKDDITEFNFDLNQYHTFEYSHRLQPSLLKKAIQEIADGIKSTLKQNTSNYSIVNKLSLQNKASEETFSGNIEVGLLQELLSEVKVIRKPSLTNERFNESIISLDVKDKADLPELLVGSTWRKSGGLEEVYFNSENKFSYTSVGMQKWLINDLSFNSDNSIMSMHWKHDGFVALCKFDFAYTSFSEKDGSKWFLIATEPFTAPSLM